MMNILLFESFKSTVNTKIRVNRSHRYNINKDTQLTTNRVGPVSSEVVAELDGGGYV